MKRDTVVRPGTTQQERNVIGEGRDAVIQAIRDARTRAGLTQEQAAAALEPHRATSTISRWETGGMPSKWEDLIEYALALNQTIVLKFGHQTQETAPAWWAEAAGQLVDQIEERMMPATSGFVTPEQAVEILTRAVERLGLPQQPPAEDPAAESAEPRDAADRAVKRQP